MLPLIACSCCVLSQIPPQVIYADPSCQAVLPDYRLQVTASDNCGNVTLTQVPVPGTLITVAEPAFDVMVTATDDFGNNTSIVIPVSMVDTIPPILEWVGGIAELDIYDIGSMWDNFSKAIKYHGIAEAIYNIPNWKPDSLDFAFGVERGLWYFFPTIELDSAEYAEVLNYKDGGN